MTERLNRLRSARSQRPAAATLLALLLTLPLLLAACAPGVSTEVNSSSLQPFTVEELPREQRYIIAVPNFEVRSGAVRIGRVDLEKEGDAFFDELGSGVADIFVSEAFRSGRFRITERAELDKVLREQDLARSGRIDPTTAAELGQITGAELIVLGSLSEFGVTTTGGGGGVLGVFGGSAETVTARATVDIRMVDSVSAEVLAIGIATSEASQTSVSVDVLNVIRALQAGRSGTSIIDIAVRNAIRGAIEEAARGLPAKGK